MVTTIGAVFLAVTYLPKLKVDLPKKVACHSTPPKVANNPPAPKVANNPPAVPLFEQIFKGKPGKARIHVTWEYNKYVGNRPDTNAVVVLIPKNFRGKGLIHLSPQIAHIGFAETKKQLRQQHVYVGLVGGNGDAVITGVPADDYELIILSKNTTESPEGKAHGTETRFWAPTLNIAGMNKVHFTEITIVSGEEEEYSHDFGNTYF